LFLLREVPFWYNCRVHSPTGFSIDRDRGFGADDRANRAARTAGLDQLGGVIPAGGDAFDGKGNHMLRAGGSTQFTALAIGLIDYDPSFGWHLLPPIWIEIIREYG
jgi:hypothetical protein